MSLHEPCRAARAARIEDCAQARAFFERHFAPVRISRLGDAEGFVTGYYEPVLEGSRTYSEQFPVPVLRRPSNLFVRGVRSPNASLPNKGEVFRKIGRRKLVPYYDRAEIEDGILSGRGLEICYVRNFTELLFMQIQGSARIKLEDGSTLRLNYDAHNGQSYTPVGRILIERNIVPREEMSMQRIRDYMASQSGGGKGAAAAEQGVCLFSRGAAFRQGRSRRRARHSIDGRPFDRGRSHPACLRHAVLHRSQPADRIGTIANALSPADGVAGHRLGDRRPGARGYLFWRGRRGWPRLGPAQARRALRDAGAEEPRSGGRRQAHDFAGRAAVGENRKAVSAGQAGAQGSQSRMHRRSPPRLPRRKATQKPRAQPTRRRKRPRSSPRRRPQSFRYRRRGPTFRRSDARSIAATTDEEGVCRHIPASAR